MAAEVQIALGNPNLNPTFALHLSGVLVASGLPMEHAGEGFYVGHMPAGQVVPGTYSVRIVDPKGELLGYGQLNWDGSKEIDSAKSQTQAFTQLDTLTKQIDEIHVIHGLEKTKPLVVQKTKRQAGQIEQKIDEVNEVVTVTRTDSN